MPLFEQFEMQFVMSTGEAKRLVGKWLEALKSNVNVLLTSKSRSSEMLRFEELIEVKKSDTEKVVSKLTPIPVEYSFVVAEIVDSWIDVVMSVDAFSVVIEAELITEMLELSVIKIVDSWIDVVMSVETFSVAIGAEVVTEMLELSDIKIVESWILVCCIVESSFFVSNSLIVVIAVE